MTGTTAAAGDTGTGAGAAGVGSTGTAGTADTGQVGQTTQTGQSTQTTQTTQTTQSGQNAAGANQTGTSPVFDWAQQGLDTESSSYVTAKGWKTPTDLLSSYRAAEKLIGVPPDSVVKIPQGDYNQEAMNTQVYDRLGRPKTAAEYKLPVPEGQDPKFAETVSGWFHETGLNPKQAQALATKWNEHLSQIQTQGDQATAQRYQSEVTNLKTEWGPQYDTNMALVDQAATAFGLEKPQLEALKRSLGPGLAAKMLHNIGSRLGVSDNVQFGERALEGAILSPQDAQAEINALKADKAFSAKYAQGDSESKAKMNRLMRMAYPGNITA